MISSNKPRICSKIIGLLHNIQLKNSKEIMKIMKEKKKKIKIGY